MSARIVELIETEEREGLGRDASDPIRLVTRWYSKDGTLLFERDPWKESQAVAPPADGGAPAGGQSPETGVQG